MPKPPRKIIIAGHIVSEAGVHVVKDRYGKNRAYYPRSGMRLDIDKGLQEFYNSLAAAKLGKPKNDDDTVTVKNISWLIDDYMQSQAYIRIKPNSKLAVRKIYQEINETLGKITLKSFNDKAIRGYIKNWRDTMIDTPSKADRAIGVLHQLIEYARLETPEINHNWIAGIDKIYTKTNRSESVWTQEQIDLFLQHASPIMQNVFKFALYSGQRKSDVLNVKISNINVKEKHIAIIPEKTRTHKKPDGKMVTVPLTKKLLQLVKEIYKNHSRTTDRLFEFETQNLDGEFYKAMRKSGLKDSGLTFHDLRGTYITNMRARGVSRDIIEYITGNKSALSSYEKRGFHLIQKNMEELKII